MSGISKQIEQYTASISKFEQWRNYISLSHSILPADELLNQYYHGFQDSHEMRLRCYKGYQMEKDLKLRLLGMSELSFSEHHEISAFAGLVMGHPDLRFYPDGDKGIPADCKSVPLDEHLPEKLVPKRVYWQMQGYMLYECANRALVIYESRETGKIRDYMLLPNASVQREIDTKMHHVVNVINQKAA